MSSNLKLLLAILPTLTAPAIFAVTVTHVLSQNIAYENNVKLNPTPEGMVLETTKGTDSVTSSQSRTFTAVPRTGMVFSRWELCDNMKTAHAKLASFTKNTANPVTITWADVDYGTYSYVSLEPHFVWLNYQLSYSLNGGVGTVEYPANLIYTNQVTVAAAPSRVGYEFDGWQCPAGTFSAGQTVTGENLNATTAGVTLSAQWEPISYTVSFDGGGAESGSMSPVSLTYDESATLPANGFRKYGHKFKRWIADDARTYLDGATVMNLAEESGATVTMTAEWEADNCEIVFYANGGLFNGGVENFTKTFAVGEQFDDGIAGHNQFPVTPIRNDHVFIGWYTAASGGTLVTNGSIVEKTVSKLYAHWTGAEFNVAFDGNGNTDGKMPNQVFRYDQSDALNPCEFLKRGYSFLGWADNLEQAAALEITYGDNQVVMNPPRTLYAVWSTNDYWISFQPNGATVGESYIQQFTYDVPQVLQSPATPYYKGEFFTFLGWARTEDATEPEYLDGATVSDVFEQGTNYLYAVWKKEPHDFSDAVGLENLLLQSKEHFGAPLWVIDNTAANALEGTNCVVAVGCGKTQRMFVRVRERGYISFSWKTDYTGTDALFSVTTNALESISGVPNSEIATDAQPTTAWTQVNVNIESADVPELAWLVRLPTGKHLWVDQMRWHPGEVAPEPVDPDPPTPIDPDPPTPVDPDPPTPVDPDPPTPPAPEFVIRTSGGWVESDGVYTDTETNNSDSTKRGEPLIAELPGSGTLTWEWNADYDFGSTKCFALETEEGPLPLFYYPNEDQWESGSFETDEPCTMSWYFKDVNNPGAWMHVRNIVWTPSAEPSGNLPVNVISITGGKFSINVTLKAGKTYVIEATDSLNPQNWTTVKTVTADRDGATLLEVENITRSTRFYRINMR